MTDLLRMDYINSLPQPFFVVCGNRWPIEDIDVESGIIRIDVCGMLEVHDIGEFSYIIDANGVKHETDSFFSDYVEENKT